MLSLTRENFIKARNHIFSYSDDINRAWFRYNFEDGDTNAFMDVLGKYQHDNGGFGGLSHEFEYQGPCLKCTKHAFDYMFYLKEKPPASHPVIQKMMKYLLKRYRPDIGSWGEFLEPEVNDSAHVWWWTYGEDDYSPVDDEDERIKRYNPNGQAALAAIVALYSELVPEDVYRDIIRYPVEKILLYYDEVSPLFGPSSTDKANKWDLYSPYNLKCYQQFCDCLKDKPLVEKLKSILKQNPTACMEMDESVWDHGYHEKPCDVVDTPDSFIYPVVKDAVDNALDYMIRHQHADGAWRFNFPLGEGEAFDRLKVKCDAQYTMLYLAKSNRFGRIET
ncbi:hypothetical protein ACFLXY_03310 [Chloroflexota bacterium]